MREKVFAAVHTSNTDVVIITLGATLDSDSDSLNQPENPVTWARTITTVLYFYLKVVSQNLNKKCQIRMSSNIAVILAAIMVPLVAIILLVSVVFLAVVIVCRERKLRKREEERKLK